MQAVPAVPEVDLLRSETNLTLDPTPYGVTAATNINPAAPHLGEPRARAANISQP